MEETTMTPTPTIPRARSLAESDALFLGALALAKVLMHLPFLGRYGYHHDELYFLACGRHLSWGYVDHPPLVPWIARLADELFGGSLVALRALPLLAGAALVVMTAVLVKRLGGGRFAQLTAALAILAAPVFVRPANVLAIPSFEALFWVTASYFLVRILDGESPRLWLAVGLVAGVGLLNKHTMLFFGLGLVCALASSRDGRRQFLSPWLWLGGGVAALVFLPNLLWQMANDWPTVEFIRNLNAGVMSEISPAQFVLGQVMYPNPFAAPVWIAGLAFYFSAAGRRYRALGWIWVVVFVLLLSVGSKIYYLMPAYPALFAAGGVAIERWAAVRRWLRPAMASALVFGALLLAPLSLPIFPIDVTERYIQAITFHAFDNAFELTGDLHGQFGWQERVDAVAKAWESLPPAERQDAPILTSWYGPAGAIDFFGRAHGLPPAVSGHMSYHLWGPPKPFTTAVTGDIAAERLEELFDEVEVIEVLELEDVNPWDRRFTVAVVRGPKFDVQKDWMRFRRFGH